PLTDERFGQQEVGGRFLALLFYGHVLSCPALELHRRAAPASWPASSCSGGMASSPLVDSAPFDFHGKRVLIFIVAYNAARTIEEVLNRIPSSLHSSAVEVLIIDDSSADDTF